LAAGDARHLARSWARRTHILASAVSVALAVLSCTVSLSALDSFTPSAPSGATTAAATTVTGTPYPLKASANNRYLVDQDNVPFLVVGDSPQALIGNLSPGEAAAFIANRLTYGINALWINLLCNASTGCSSDGATFDAIAPFTVPGDLSTPNPAYFRRADDMIRLAATHGMVVILDPIETIGWLNTLKANGAARAFAYGQYLGNRYRDFPNIIWMHGNDFQSWQDAADDALVRAVALGIRSTDPNHIHTVELNYLTSGSLDDPTWAALIELNAAYTYFPTYVQVLTEYNRSKFKPVLMVEANYEFEHNWDTDGGSTQNLRRQEYWTMLSGATGQVYGSAHTWRIDKGWETKLDTPGVIQLGYMKDLFIRRKWYDLVPDQTHTMVTAGYDGLAGYIGRLTAYFGSHPGRLWKLFAYFKRLTHFGSIMTNTYVTAARTSDGSLVIAYMPTIRTITVDMSKLASVTTARWFDPTNGTYLAINGSPFANVGDGHFTPPGNNSAGDSDWVLVLEAVAQPE
jgi:hypothetical protein